MGVDDLFVTTRVPSRADAGGGIEAFALVPLDGDGTGWPGVAVVRRDGDDGVLLALVAVDDDVAARLLDGVADQLRAAGCARFRSGGSVSEL